VDAFRPQPQLLELRDLVLHEGDERRDHDRRAAAGEAGELVAERLPGAGGHHQQDVPALHDGAAHRLLVRAEGGKPEPLAQEGGERVAPSSRVRLGLRGARGRDDRRDGPSARTWCARGARVPQGRMAGRDVPGDPRREPPPSGPWLPSCSWAGAPVVLRASVWSTSSRTKASIRSMNSGSPTSFLRILASWASHSPVSAALFTWGWTRSTSRMPVSVAARVFPWRSA